MLKTPKNYVYDKISDSISKQDYKIENNDIMTMRIFSNDGFKIIDLATAGQMNQYLDLHYLINNDGTCKLPLVGKLKLSGLSIREATEYLEQAYSEFYIKPFVYIGIINKRVTVFPGNGGAAKVINLTNNNTTVMEVIALAGGIAEDGKAYKVKLIRRENKSKPKIYLMDLSTINGLESANTVVLANDIIYIEPRYRLAKTLISEISPILSILSSAILIYTLIIRR